MGLLAPWQYNKTTALNNADLQRMQRNSKLSANSRATMTRQMCETHRGVRHSSPKPNPGGPTAQYK